MEVGWWSNLSHRLGNVWIGNSVVGKFDGQVCSSRGWITDQRNIVQWSNHGCFPVLWTYRGHFAVNPACRQCTLTTSCWDCGKVFPCFSAFSHSFRHRSSCPGDPRLSPSVWCWASCSYGWSTPSCSSSLGTWAPLQTPLPSRPFPNSSCLSLLPCISTGSSVSLQLEDKGRQPWWGCGWKDNKLNMEIWWQPHQG